MNTTLRALFECAATEEAPDHLFLRWHEKGAWQTRTYRDCLARVKALAEWFGESGLQPRKTHVALFLPNGPLWIESYLAITSIAGAVVHTDPKLTAQELLHILSDSNAEMVVTDRAHLPKVLEIRDRLPALKRLLLTDDAPDEGPLPTDTLACVVAKRLATPATYWENPTYRPQPEDLCGLLYTSGTTGKPKGAMLSHANFTADAIGTLNLLTGYITPADDFLVVLPLFHAFAFTTNFVIALQTHAQLSFLRSLRTLTDDLRILQSTVLMTVPLMSEKLHARLIEKVHATWQGRLLHRFLPRLIGRRILTALGGKLRLIIVGGAKADPIVLRDFNRMGITMAEGYGLTECAPVVSVNPPGAIRVGTIGTPVRGIEVRLAQPDAQGIGELQVRGPINFLGYWQNPAATQATFDGEWLKTGDLAAIDKQGYLTIRGRAKALIVNREGKNIYPEEVEQAIARDELIGQVIVLAYHSKEEPGERVGAIITPNEEAFARLHPQADRATIETLLREAVKRQIATLAAYKHPRKVVISHEPLTLTSTHKVRRCCYAGTLDE